MGSVPDPYEIDGIFATESTEVQTDPSCYCISLKFTAVPYCFLCPVQRSKDIGMFAFVYIYVYNICFHGIKSFAQ